MTVVDKIRIVTTVRTEDGVLAALESVRKRILAVTCTRVYLRRFTLVIRNMIFDENSVQCDTKVVKPPE